YLLRVLADGGPPHRRRAGRDPLHAGPRPLHPGAHRHRDVVAGAGPSDAGRGPDLLPYQGKSADGAELTRGIGGAGLARPPLEVRQVLLLPLAAPPAVVAAEDPATSANHDSGRFH